MTGLRDHWRRAVPETQRERVRVCVRARARVQRAERRLCGGFSSSNAKVSRSAAK